MTLGSFPSVSASKMDHGVDCIVDIVNGIVRCKPLLPQRSCVENVSALIFKRNVTPFNKHVVGFAAGYLGHTTLPPCNSCLRRNVCVVSHRAMFY
jgi:hypothetical protein